MGEITSPSCLIWYWGKHVYSYRIGLSRIGLFLAHGDSLLGQCFDLADSDGPETDDSGEDRYKLSVIFRSEISKTRYSTRVECSGSPIIGGVEERDGQLYGHGSGSI